MGNRIEFSVKLWISSYWSWNICLSLIFVYSYPLQQQLSKFFPPLPYNPVKDGLCTELANTQQLILLPRWVLDHWLESAAWSLPFLIKDGCLVLSEKKKFSDVLESFSKLKKLYFALITCKKSNILWRITWEHFLLKILSCSPFYSRKRCILTLSWVLPTDKQPFSTAGGWSVVRADLQQQAWEDLFFCAMPVWVFTLTSTDL